MRSKRCAVQNQGITLSFIFKYSYILNYMFYLLFFISYVYIFILLTLLNVL